MDSTPRAPSASDARAGRGWTAPYRRTNTRWRPGADQHALAALARFDAQQHPDQHALARFDAQQHPDQHALVTWRGWTRPRLRPNSRGFGWSLNGTGCSWRRPPRRGPFVHRLTLPLPHSCPSISPRRTPPVRAQRALGRGRPRAGGEATEHGRGWATQPIDLTWAWDGSAGALQRVGR
jgi:hypothetical protein